MPTAVRKTASTRRKRWRVGQVMTHHAYDGSGVLLLAAGQRVEDEAKARRLSAVDVRLVRPGEEREDSAPQRAGAQPAQPQTVPYREEIKRAWRVRSSAVRRVTTVLRRLQAGGQVTQADVEPVVRPIVESVLRNATALTSLVRMKSFDRYTFTHSVNVCVLTLVLAREYDAETDLIEMGTGALLHDMGKMRLATHILNKTAALSPVEFSQVQKHPGYGVEMLARSPESVSDTVMRAVLHHHERHDGSGYPDRLSGERISVSARLVAVADTYDAMTTVRPYRRSILPKDALAWMYAQRGLKYDPATVVAFIRAVGIYPIGSGVRLNTGEVAVVVGVNRDNLARPAVIAVRDASGRKVPPAQIVHLAEDQEREIVSHVDLSALGVNPAEYLAVPTD